MITQTVSKTLTTSVFQSDPLLLGATVEFLRRYFVDVIEDKSLKPNERKALAAILQGLYLDLPDELQNGFAEDQKLLSLIGIGIRATSTLGDATFEHDKFISAISLALSGVESVLVSDSGIEVRFRAVRDESDCSIVEYSESGSARWARCDPILGLLSDSLDDRERILRCHQRWFDCSSSEYKETVARIVSIEDPDTRVKRADALRQASMSRFYAESHSKIQAEQAFSLPELIPSDWKDVLNHLRLPNDLKGVSLRSQLENAFVELVGQEGFVEAYRRLASLPIPLPLSILNYFLALPSNEQRTVVKKLIRSAATPLTRIHLIRLLCGSENIAFHKLAGRIVRWLVASKNEFSAYMAVIIWVEEVSARSTWCRSLSVPLRLALIWSHGSELVRMFFSLATDYERLRNLFGRIVVPISPEAIERNHAYFEDVAHPKKVSRVVFLVDALNYAMEGKNSSLAGTQATESLRSDIFSEENGQLWPNPQIMRDNRRLSDSMESIFGGDFSIKISQILGNELGNMVSSDTLEAWALAMLRNITVGRNPNASWLMWNAIVGRMPPYEKCIEPLTGVIKTAQFHLDSELGIGHGAVPIFCASLSLWHLNDPEAVAHVESELISFSKRIGIANDENDRTIEKSTSLLFDVALNIALTEKQGKAAAQKLASLMLAICTNAPRCIPDAKLIAQRFCDELPTTLAVEFWPLLLTIRAL